MPQKLQEISSMRFYLKNFLVIAFVPALLISFLSAADETTWSPNDIILAERAGSLELSPDGEWAVWVKSQMDKEKGRQISNLYLSSLTKEKEIQLTRGKDSYSSPKWSPDGSRIAFISTRPSNDSKDSETQRRLWMLDTEGGEPYVAFKLDRSVSSYGWKGDKTIVFTAEEESSLYAKEKRTLKTPPISLKMPSMRLR